MTTPTRSQSIMIRTLDNSAAAHDPLSTTSLLATAGVQELLESYRRPFQPLDADFAEQIHRELYQKLLTLPKSWEDGQQGHMKMTLAATTYFTEQEWHIDLLLMRQSKNSRDPDLFYSPWWRRRGLLKPQPAATTSFQGSGSG